MEAQIWLDEVIEQLRQTRRQCERAAQQVDGDDFFATLGDYPMSVGLTMKHIGGNLRSRWRDFLTTDGEKADRRRDAEFLLEPGDTRALVEAGWHEGWSIALASLEALEPADLERSVTIRGEPHSVTQAILRTVGHLSYHGGQIVLLARHFAGEHWQTLSVAVGESEQHNDEMRRRFGDWSA